MRKILAALSVVGALLAAARLMRPHRTSSDRGTI